MRDYLTDADGPDLDKKIDRAGYDADDLKKIVLALDGQKIGSHAAGGEARSHDIVARFYAAVGTGYSKYTFTGSVGDGVFSPGIYGRMDLVRVRNNGDLAVRLEAGYFSSSYKGHGTDAYGETYTYTVKASTINPSVSVLYYLYRGDQLRLFAGAGVAFDISSYSNGIYRLYVTGVPNQQDYKISPQPFWGQLQLKVGAQVSNRLSVEVLGGLPAAVNPNVEPFTSGSIIGFALKVGYCLNGTH
jgi:hypothetical protein